MSAQQKQKSDEEKLLDEAFDLALKLQEKQKELKEKYSIETTLDNKFGLRLL